VDACVFDVATLDAAALSTTSASHPSMPEQGSPHALPLSSSSSSSSSLSSSSSSASSSSSSMWRCGAPRAGDALEVRTLLQLRLKGVALVFHHEIWRPDGNAPLAQCVCTVYSIRASDKQPSPVPSWFNSLVEAFLAP
jgi:hypothetical protein